MNNKELALELKTKAKEMIDDGFFGDAIDVIKAISSVEHYEYRKKL